MKGFSLYLDVIEEIDFCSMALDFLTNFLTLGYCTAKSSKLRSYRWQIACASFASVLEMRQLHMKEPVSRQSANRTNKHLQNRQRLTSKTMTPRRIMLYIYVLSTSSCLDLFPSVRCVLWALEDVDQAASFDHYHHLGLSSWIPSNYSEWYSHRAHCCMLQSWRIFARATPMRNIHRISIRCHEWRIWFHAHH